jgi:PTS system nitrogen regulatory IIA component
MELRDCIPRDGVCFIDKTDKAGVIAELVEMSLQTGQVGDPEEFRRAITERENLMSTGIGLGVAIPHAKLSSLKGFFALVGVLEHEVEWDALDKKPVNLVFLIGGPDDDQGAYLQILARIMLVIKDDDRLKRLKAAKTADEVFAALSAGG